LFDAVPLFPFQLPPLLAPIVGAALNASLNPENRRPLLLLPLLPPAPAPANKHKPAVTSPPFEPPCKDNNAFDAVAPAVVAGVLVFLDVAIRFIVTFLPAVTLGSCAADVAAAANGAACGTVALVSVSVSVSVFGSGFGFAASELVEAALDEVDVDVDVELILLVVVDVAHNGWTGTATALSPAAGTSMHGDDGAEVTDGGRALLDEEGRGGDGFAHNACTGTISAAVA